MTIEQYWIILIKQWKLVVICFIIVGLGAYAGSKLMKPVYQSSVLVQVAIQSDNNQAQYDSLLASEQLIQTESQLAVSDAVLREVATHYAGLTPEQLAKQVTSSAKLNTQLFEIDVQDTSPTRASILGNDIANTLIKHQLQATQQANGLAEQKIQLDLESTGQQIDALTSQIATLQEQRNQQPRVAVLQSQLNGLQQHYSQWQLALAQLQLKEAQNADFLRVVQVAQPALQPVLPNTLLNTGIGLGAGLLLGILLALLAERLDTRVRNPEEIARLVEWPALATIWRTTSAREAVVHPQGRDGNVEAYRILRTNIGFADVDTPLRSLLVTSGQSGDGKSVVASNLAIFMAKAGKRTLLIDGDLRRPTLHEKFDLPTEAMGFSEAILAFSKQAANSSYSSPIYRGEFHPDAPAEVASTAPTGTAALGRFVHAVDIPNLYVMPAGLLPPNPPELLDSKAMQQLLAAIVDGKAEIVIFDGPPMLGLSDASILASKVEGALIVVDITHANKRNLKQMKALLAQTGVRVIGYVVNKQRRARRDALSAYYYRAEAQKGTKTHSMEDAKSEEFASVTPELVEEPETQPSGSQ